MSRCYLILTIFILTSCSSNADQSEVLSISKDEVVAILCDVVDGEDSYAITFNGPKKTTKMFIKADEGYQALHADRALKFSFGDQSTLSVSAKTKPSIDWTKEEYKSKCEVQNGHQYNIQFSGTEGKFEGKLMISVMKEINKDLPGCFDKMMMARPPLPEDPIILSCVKTQEIPESLQDQIDP